MSAIEDVAAERRRQVEEEGWTAEHDDQHRGGSMAVAAACYSLTALPDGPSNEFVSSLWPWTGWASKWFKPTDKRRNLVKAAALIVAEIERLDRAEANKWKPCSRCTTHDFCHNGIGGCDLDEMAR